MDPCLLSRIVRQYLCWQELMTIKSEAAKSKSSLEEQLSDKAALLTGIGPFFASAS